MPWNMAYNSYFPQQEYQQMPSSWSSGAPGLSPIHLQHPNMQPTHTGSTSYGSFFPVHSSDYHTSQSTREELQQNYVTGGYPLAQLPTNTSGVASFGPTMAAQVGPLPDLNFSPPIQMMGYGPHSSCRSTRSNNLDEDEVWTCGPVSKKRRRHFSDGERKQRNAIRKMGSCARCRSLKLGVSQASAPRYCDSVHLPELTFCESQCDQGNPCKRCLENGPKARTYLGPCFRGNLEELTLARQG